MGMDIRMATNMHTTMDTIIITTTIIDYDY